MLTGILFTAPVFASVTTPPMAAGLAAATIGTETDGSITCPAGVNGIVGFKPTVGLVSRCLSFIGPQWHDHAVLKAGYAYEQLSKARVAPTFRASVDSK